MMMLLTGLGLTALTVVVHGAGSIFALKHAFPSWKRPLDAGVHKGIVGGWIVYLVCALLVLHIAEALIWAACYRALGLLPSFEIAAYYSLASYTTVGFGDVVLSGEWRMLGPIESAVGMLMFGWSTGLIVAAITRFYQDTRSPDDPAGTPGPQGGGG